MTQGRLVLLLLALLVVAVVGGRGRVSNDPAVPSAGIVATSPARIDKIAVETPSAVLPAPAPIVSPRPR